MPVWGVVSEGVGQLRAGDGEDEEGKEARKEFEVDGSGVTVGILSDSFNRATEAADGSGPIATHAPQDVSAGDLPGAGNTCIGETTPVDVLDDAEADGEDEGRAMAQIVHDVAPGASLAFATAFSGEIAFAENIEKLAEPVPAGAEAGVIADDVTYFEEPFFQEGPVGVAVKNVTEQGVSYFSSAGNNNLIDGGQDIASWEAPQFRDAGACPAALASLEASEGLSLNGSHCMDFNPGVGTDTTFGIAVANGATLTVDVQWAEAWEGVGTDVDAFLVGPGGSIVAASDGDNPASGRPFELIGWENNTGSSTAVQLVINRFSGGNPRLKLALLQNGGGVGSTEYPESIEGDIVGPTIFGHNGGEDTISVGAIHYTASSAPEPYSSRGPVTHYFGPVDGPTPAKPLGSAQILSKPDITATDCGATTFFASFASAESTWRFCGTSAAAPHAAGVAALLRQKDPAATPEEIHAALVDGATQIGVSGACAVGAGLVEAVGAVQHLLAPEPVSKESCAPPHWKVLEEGQVEGVAIPVAPVEEIPSPSLPAPPGAAKPSPPGTFFRQLPAKVLRTSGHTVEAVIRFGSDESDVTFLCKVDRGRFHRCSARFVRRYSLGRHVVRVKARNSDGATDSTPATYRFRVKHVRAG